jgi:tRNA U34 5-carboxymethylaminomethyl modifying GTPase MnmE/TrmE
MSHISSRLPQYHLLLNHLTADESLNDIVIGAEELKYAADALGKISGRIDPEEILGS